jgi:hypothetical protein
MPRRSRSATVVAAVAVLAFASPGHALMIFGTGVDAESAAGLAALLSQTVGNGLTLTDLLTKTQEAIRVAQETAGLLRSASEVVVDIQHISQSPDQLFDEAQASFGASFPELEAISRDVEATRSNLAGEHASDPRGLFDLIAHARQTKQGVYQTLMAYDNLADGQLGEYLRDVKLAQVTAQAAMDLRQATQGPLDTKTATVLTAKAAALSATAEAQSAAAALEMSRVLKQQYVNDRQRETGNELAKAKNANDLAHSMPADESVDGLATLRNVRDANAPVVEKSEGVQ